MYKGRRLLFKRSNYGWKHHEHKYPYDDWQALIILNTGINTLFSIGSMLFDIYKKIKKKTDDKVRESTVKKPITAAAIQNINLAINAVSPDVNSNRLIPPIIPESSLPSYSVLQKGVYQEAVSTTKRKKKKVIILSRHIEAS